LIFEDRRRGPMASLKLGVSLAAGVIAAVLMFKNISGALTYSVPVEELVYKKTEYVGQVINLEGQVIKKSIKQKPGTMEYRFEVVPKKLREGMTPSQYRDKVPENSTVSVYHNGEVADTFFRTDEQGNGAEVTITGSLDANGVFQSQKIAAKCPSKYEEEKKGAIPSLPQ
jgi:cytochrome c-type biogenesis protein CcmE